MDEARRFPLLTEAGQRRLRWLEEHPHAPRYNHRCGDRLTGEGLQRLHALRNRPQVGWGWGETPDWLEPFVHFAIRTVPFYRKRGMAEFTALPPTRREDVIREPWAFVPDHQPLDDMILYFSSQTTGEKVTVLSHPEVSARDLPLIESLLSDRGVALKGGGRPCGHRHGVCSDQHPHLSQLDLYALNETGVIAVDGEVLGSDVYVEILSADGEPCAPSERGEIVVTGGTNPFLPLLRYRTGDFAALDCDGPRPRLTGLEPRSAVIFPGNIHSYQITAAVAGLAISAFTMHLATDGSFVFRYRGEGDVRGALEPLLGSAPLCIDELPPPYEWGGKLVQYAYSESGLKQSRSRPSCSMSGE